MSYISTGYLEGQDYGPRHIQRRTPNPEAPNAVSAIHIGDGERRSTGSGLSRRAGVSRWCGAIRRVRRRSRSVRPRGSEPGDRGFGRAVTDMMCGPDRRTVRLREMIRDDHELEATSERIRHFQAQLAHLRRTETNPTNYRHSASGCIAEIDRMQLEVREYLSELPSAAAAT